MDSSTEHIMEGLKKGDVEVFNFLYKTYFERLCGYSFRFINDSELVKDIVNECFFMLWNKREQIDCHSIKAYLFVMVRNESLNHIKHTNIRNNILSPLPEDSFLFDETEYSEIYSDPEHVLLQKELEEIIEDVIENLPSQCKKVYHLNRIDGLKNKEIASKLNLSIKTVEMHMTRALSALTKRIKKYNSFF